MASQPQHPRPRWQRNPVFKFFASLKLAVVLLAVLIIASIIGTLYESNFDAKVARAYVYGAPWFNVWLLFLATNLAVAAFSRWPWKSYHVAFLVTHLGIITLLVGSMVGRIWGTEGTITLFKGEPPTNRLLLDQRQLRVRDSDGILKGYPAEFIHRPPSPQRPKDLGQLASGARLRIVDYAPAIEGKLNPRPLQNGGVPAVHFTITTNMMGQKLESWLLPDDPQHGTFSMGLATIAFKRGAAPKVEPNESKSGEVEIEENIFAFSKAPDEQVGKVVKGGNSGAKLVLSQPHDSDKGKLTVSLGEKNWTRDVAANIGKDTPLEGSSFTLRIENYWPNFRIDNGKPASLGEEPANPAVLVNLRGKGLPAQGPVGDPHGPAAGQQTGQPNKLTIFLAEDGVFTYELVSRTGGRSTGKLEKEQPLKTGWADWAFTLDRTLPHAEHWMDFQPVMNPPATANLPDGIRLRIENGNESFEQWAPAGWQITIPTSPVPIEVAYGWKVQQLPIALELLDFEVQRNEGIDSPAGFKSTVRVMTPQGESATGQCWMNNPFSFPGQWWRTWSGNTYKMSQASWNPENLGQSTIQILRDPGWLLKWIGSLLVSTGIFMLFYVKRFRRPTAAPPIAPPPATSRQERKEVMIA